MNSTFLSLVIPCYNEFETLETCVEACMLLTQHNIQLELVIVDDCSTDNSLVVVIRNEFCRRSLTVSIKNASDILLTRIHS